MLETLRKSSKSIEFTHCNGELTNNSAIETAVSEADVVISTLGPGIDLSRKRKGTPIADGHNRIVKAMKKFTKKVDYTRDASLAI